MILSNEDRVRLEALAKTLEAPSYSGKDASEALDWFPKLVRMLLNPDARTTPIEAEVTGRLRKLFAATEGPGNRTRQLAEFKEALAQAFPDLLWAAGENKVLRSKIASLEQVQAELRKTIYEQEGEIIVEGERRVEAEAKLAEVKRESESRREMLLKKSDEVRDEWLRAENAEVALTVAVEALKLVKKTLAHPLPHDPTTLRGLAIAAQGDAIKALERIKVPEPTVGSGTKG